MDLKLPGRPGRKAKPETQRPRGWEAKLAWELQDLLGLPFSHKNVYAYEAYKAVRAVVETIKAALLRGEKVFIVGFGTFYPSTRKGYYSTKLRTKNDFDPSTPGNQFAGYVKPKTSAKFRPSPSLKTYVDPRKKENEP